MESVINFISDNPRFTYLLFTGLLVKPLYVYGTFKEDEITVKQKIILPSGFVSYGDGALKASYIIVTDDNQIMKRNFSLWKGQFYYPEKWFEMEEGKRYKIGKYGWRIPLPNPLYPNIVDSELIEKEKPER